VGHNCQIVDPKFRQLRAFALAYRLGSLTQASEKMHLTQSALSQLTRQLEENLGLRLFDRTTRALRPTQAADEAIVVVERILADVDFLKTSLRGLADKSRGQVNFACTPSFAATRMPSVLQDLLDSHPGIKTVMRDAAPDLVMQLVLNGDVEFGILMRIEERHDVDFAPLLVDHLCVICREDSPLALQEKVRWKDLAAEKIIAIDGGSGLPTLIEQTLAAQGESFQPAYGFSYLHTALAMTAQGLGISLLPSYLIKNYPAHTRLISRMLCEPVVPRHLYLVTKKGSRLSPAAGLLVETLSAALA
jgi:LysR family transcriptional regulator, carnitine catabolism transcriptional activator